MNYVELVEKYKSLLDHPEGFDEILKRFSDILENSKCDSPIIEIGTNKGGSALCFLEVLKHHNRTNWFYTVDPYGSIPYHNGGFVTQEFVYPNSLYRNSMKEISLFCCYNELNHHHFKTKSEEFINNIYPNFVQYDIIEKKFDKFLFVFLDGSHDVDVVIKEVMFFCDKLEPNGMIIVDDLTKDEGAYTSVISAITSLPISKYLETDNTIRQRLAIKKNLVENK